MARTTHPTPDPSRPAGDGARRRRPALVTFGAVAAAVGLLGFAGVFATGSDRATTGANDARSGENGVGPQDVDLQIATASYDPVTGAFDCSTDWSEDLTSGVISSDGLPVDQQLAAPGYDEGYLCLRNVGTASTGVVASTFNVVDAELACSPGESDVDTTCGSGVGELSASLATAFYLVEDGSAVPPDTNVGTGNCYDNGTAYRTLSELDDAAATIPVGTLEPGQVVGLCADVGFTAGAPDTDAQSDSVTWQYAFDTADLSTPPPPCDSNDEYEPNQSLEHAHGTIGDDDQLSGITCGEDADWYVSATAEHRPGTISLDWEDGAELTLTLADGNGDVSDSASSSSGHIDLPVSDLYEVYDIGVSSTSESTTPYTLTVSTGTP